MNKECKCRWCQRAMEMTPEVQEYIDELLLRLDYWGEMSLTEDQQALVHYGPLCEDCELQA